MSALIRLYVLLSAVPLLVGATALAFMGLAFADRIYPNVAIGGIMVGGLTSREATARLRAHATGAMGQPLLIRAGPAGLLGQAGSDGHDAVTTSLGELGVTVAEDGIRRSVRAALAVGRPEGGRSASTRRTT